MNRLELIERVDLAIITYHANLQNRYSAIDIVDRGDAKTGDFL